MCRLPANKPVASAQQQMETDSGGRYRFFCGSICGDLEGTEINREAGSLVILNLVGAAAAGESESGVIYELVGWMEGCRTGCLFCQAEKQSSISWKLLMSSDATADWRE